MKTDSHAFQVSSTGNGISHNILVARHVRNVPVYARQRLDPAGLLAIQALLGLQVFERVVVSVNVHRLVIFQVTSPLACCEHNCTKLLFKGGMVYLRGIHFPANPSNGQQGRIGRLCLHKDSPICIVAGICVQVERTIQVRVAHACSIYQRLFDI